MAGSAYPAAGQSPAVGLRRFAILMAVWFGAAAPARALDTIPDLGGRWVGPGLQLFIDTERHQGNADPSRPFNRDSFFIRNVTGNLVVFVIGPDLYVGRLDDPNTMQVSRGGGIESWTVRRAKR